MKERPKLILAAAPWVIQNRVNGKFLTGTNPAHPTEVLLWVFATKAAAEARVNELADGKAVACSFPKPKDFFGFLQIQAHTGATLVGFNDGNNNLTVFPILSVIAGESPPRDEWSREMANDDGTPSPGGAFANDLVSVTWKWFERVPCDEGADGERPPSFEALKALVFPAFQASLQSEEARQVRFQLLFTTKPNVATIRFSKPIDYSASNLTKLSPTIGIGHRRFVIAPAIGNAGALEIVGVWDPTLTPHNDPSKSPQWAVGFIIPPQLHPGLTVSVLGPGCMRITTGEGKSFELRNCSVFSPFSIAEIDSIAKWFAEAGEALGPEPSIPIIGTAAKVAVVRRTWLSILNKVCIARHGGCFLIVPDGSEVSESLKIKYSIHSELIRDVLRSRLTLEPRLLNYIPGSITIEPEILHRGHFIERETARMCDLIASLATVDGSVVLQRNLKIIGFGAEILNTKVPSNEEKIECWEYPSASSPSYDKSLSQFGMRHRSAYRFCEGMKGSIAMVVSQDGDLRLFDSVRERMRLFERIFPDASYGFILNDSDIPKDPAASA